MYFFKCLLFLHLSIYFLVVFLSSCSPSQILLNEEPIQAKPINKRLLALFKVRLANCLMAYMHCIARICFYSCYFNSLYNGCLVCLLCTYLLWPLPDIALFVITRYNFRMVDSFWIVVFIVLPICYTFNFLRLAIATVLQSVLVYCFSFKI